MRHISKVMVALALALSSSVASAQFGGLLKALPGLGGGNSNSGTDAGSIISGVAKMTKETTVEEEVAMGQETAALLLGATPLLDNPGVQRYVNTLGRWLASQTERPDLPWTFAVTNDRSYNAFAAPGGYIFITAGLFGRMRSESELAGVLAHEIAHVLRQHHLKAAKSAAGVNLGADLVARQVGGNQVVNNLTKNFVKNVLLKGLSKEDEFEADRDGMVIAARAGYSPYGLTSVLQMLAGQSAQGDDFSLLLSTHPSAIARLEKLDSLIQAQFDKVPTNAGKPLADRMKEFK